MSLINTQVKPFKAQAYQAGKFFEVTEQTLLGLPTFVSSRRSAHALLNGSGARFVHKF